MEDSEYKSSHPTPMQPKPYLHVKTDPDQLTDELVNNLTAWQTQSAQALPQIGGKKTKSRNNASIYDGPVKPETELHKQLSLQPTDSIKH